ncbi:MAG: hypothetical protein Q4B70_09650 [Lachnospiraceae bacterium]|nr:hypothetical protein [Lachnospiraceae bacterium]
MAYADYECYFIKEEEMAVLLAGAGVKQWYGLTSKGQSTEEKTPQQEDLFRIMNSLYQKNYVDWEGDTINILFPAGEAVTRIKNAVSLIQMEVKEEESKSLAYIADRKVLWLEQSQREPAMLKFSLWEAKDWLENLTEIGLLPKEEPETEEWNENRETGEEKDNSISSDDVTERGRMLLLNPDNGQQKAALIIEDQGIDTYMRILRSLLESRKPYRKKQWEEIMADWMEGKIEDDIS